MTESGATITISGLSKRFDATVALDDVGFSVNRGEVRALVGENGAGKSTFVKILSGLIKPDSGEIEVFGKTFRAGRPKLSHQLGIQTAYQELTLVPDLTVTQNMLLPYEPGTAGQINRRESHRRVKEILERLELSYVRPSALVSDLDLPTRQKIEIAKAIGRQPKILLLDEPTSTLSAADVDWLGRQIDALRDAQVTIMFISHRLPEVRRFCDSLTVLRNGLHAGSYPIGEVADEDVVRLIIGRSLGTIYPTLSDHRDRDAPHPALQAKDITAGPLLSDVSFDLWPGEVLGVAGLQGMGQRELFECLFGAHTMRRGKIAVAGRPVTLTAPADAVKMGMSLVPEERKTDGLFLTLSGRRNPSLPVIDRLSSFGWMDEANEGRAVDEVFERLKVHPRALYKPVSSFSGGNQQKIAIAKWLLADSNILLMFDPTRGVDIGTKHEIYVLIRELAEAGKAVLFYSTEVPELVNLCDRVQVIYQGRMVAELAGEEITEEKIMRHALGQSVSDAQAGVGA